MGPVDYGIQLLVGALVIAFIANFFADVVSGIVSAFRKPKDKTSC
jgi:hypothetical protein